MKLLNGAVGDKSLIQGRQSLSHPSQFPRPTCWVRRRTCLEPPGVATILFQTYNRMLWITIHLDICVWKTLLNILPKSYPGHPAICVCLKSPRIFSPNRTHIGHHAICRRPPHSDSLWFRLRPKSRPAEDHQRWQWQIYSSNLHERYIFRIYISTWHYYIFANITRLWMDTTIWSRCLFIAQFRALWLGGRERCWFEKCWRSSALNCLPRLSLGC